MLVQHTKQKMECEDSDECLSETKKVKNFKFQENEDHEDVNHRENINKMRILSKLKKHMK